MTRKRETVFLNSVNEHLPPRVFAEKTHNPYRAGIPDCFYEAVRQKWVEYKFLDQLPARPTTRIVPGLSALQLRWLTRNAKNGHEPWVIVGSSKGGVILKDMRLWKYGLTCGDYQRLLLTRREIATAITEALS